MNREQWCTRLFQSIDGKRSGDFLSFLTPDASFRYGSAPAVEGKAAILPVLEAFFASVASLSHRVLDLWEVPGHIVCRGVVRYARHDGKSVSMPFCNVLGLRGDKIARYDIYLDPTPLAAQ